MSARKQVSAWLVTWEQLRQMGELTDRKATAMLDVVVTYYLKNHPDLAAKVQRRLEIR